jgi:hypothetical protein
LVQALESTIQIRISDLKTQAVANSIIAETLIRIFGNKNMVIANYLIKNLNDEGLSSESKIVENLMNSNSSAFTNLGQGNGLGDKYLDSPVTLQLSNGGVSAKLSNLTPVKTRESFFDLIFKLPLFSFAKRPFIKVWRNSGKN